MAFRLGLGLYLLLAVGCDSAPPPCGTDGGTPCVIEGGAPDASSASDAPVSANQPDGPASTPPDGDPSPIHGDGSTAGPPDLIFGPVRDIDILFLIDNSPSMQEEQDNLRRNFPAFMEELKKIPGGLPNVHIAVASSDLGAGPNLLGNGACRPAGDRGIFQTKPTCGLGPSSRFLASFNNGTLNNFAGPIEQVFSCMASVGTAGCGFEHQLQATRVALYESITKENTGFLRADATLAIIIISDEDDCSAETTSDLFTDDASFPMTSASFRCAQTGHQCNGLATPIGAFDVPLESCQASDAGRLIRVSEVVDSIRALKKRPDQEILVSGIFGWPASSIGARYRYVPSASQGLVDYAPICQSANGSATAGLRLKKFVESFGDAGIFSSICQDDLRPALMNIGRRLATRF